MIRSSVVFPDPDGPSSAISSPSLMSRLTSRSAEYVPKVLLILRSSMPKDVLRWALCKRSGVFATQSPFETILGRDREQRKERQQGRHGK